MQSLCPYLQGVPTSRFHRPPCTVPHSPSITASLPFPPPWRRPATLPRSTPALAPPCSQQAVTTPQSLHTASGSSLASSDEGTDSSAPLLPYVSLEPVLAAANDWNHLQLALISRGTAEGLSVEDVAGCLQRAAQLAARPACRMTAGPAGNSDRLLARAVVSLSCLILLRELDTLDLVVVSGCLGALGLLAAHGALPDINGRNTPRELVVCAAHLSHRARMAAASGLLGPNQLAGALRGAALLAPQMVGSEWLDEAQRQLGPQVMPRLAPGSVAALLGAITQARMGRAKRWSPSPQWVAALQQDIAPRLKEFSGFELAATVYGLVDLTTSSNSSDPPRTTTSTTTTATTTTSAPAAKPAGSGGEGGMNPKYAFLRLEQARVQSMRRARLDPLAHTMAAGAAQAGLHPALIGSVRAWERASWQRPAGTAGAAAGAAGAAALQGGSAAATFSNESLDDGYTGGEPAGGAGKVGTVGRGSNGNGNGTASAEGREGEVDDVTPVMIAPCDLALLLVSYTRLGQPEFVPARPLGMGMLPLEVAWAEQEMGVEPSATLSLDEDDM